MISFFAWNRGRVGYFFNGTHDDFSKIRFLDHHPPLPQNHHKKAPRYFSNFAKKPFYPFLRKNYPFRNLFKKTHPPTLKYDGEVRGSSRSFLIRYNTCLFYMYRICITDTELLLNIVSATNCFDLFAFVSIIIQTSHRP